MDLNELLQKTKGVGNPEMFHTVLRARMWEAEEDHKRRHSRPRSQADILKKYGAVRIADLEDPGPDSYLIRDFIAEGEPHYFYGSRGTLKSYDATMIAIGIASPDLTHIFGRGIEKHGVAIIFDSEMNERRYCQRIRALCRGMEIAVPRDLVYKNVVGVAPAESFPELHEMVGALGAVVVVIDSLGFATRSKPEDYAEQRNDATEYIDPIIKLGSTPITVDHKPHQGDHLFGSVAKEYHGRGIFQIKDLDGGERPTPGERRTRILNEKLSHGPDGWGIDLVTRFEMVEDEETGKPVLWKVTMEAEDAAGGGFVRGGKPDSRALVIMALEEGDKTRMGISEHSDLAPKTLEKLLPQMERARIIEVTGKEPGRNGANIYGLFRPDGGGGDPTPDPTDRRPLPSQIPRGSSAEGSSKTAKPKKSKDPTSLLEHARTNRELAKTYNLIYRRKDVAPVIDWLAGLSEVAIDTETYGEAPKKETRKKLALSLARGKIRLIQLSDGERTYLIDAMLLKPSAVVGILEACKGKTLLGHNLVFDLPRLKRLFGVDLLGEDFEDTMLLSRLARAGEWEENEELDAVAVRHSLAEALENEGVVNIAKDTDHRWEEPLTVERLYYAVDDVCYLADLATKLLELVERRELGRGLAQFKTVYREYMRMQYRGQPFDRARFEEYTTKLKGLVEDASTRIEEHKPAHPDGAEWVWGNKLKPDARDRYGNPVGRNGALRALAKTGVKIKNLKKPTRMEYILKRPGKSPLLEALNDYYIYSNLLSDSKEWLEYYVEGDRVYPNINPFSQVTGRTAYSGPALQNSPKVVDPAIGISLRDCIKAKEGHSIVKADYAAQELRILAEVVAQYNGDRKLVDAFDGGDDPHVLVGEKVAGHPLDEEKDKAEHDRYRKLGKRANYGFSYGQGAERYKTSVFEDTYERIKIDQAKKEQKAYRETWPGVHDWQQGFGDRWGNKEEDWHTLSFTGRRRYVGRSWDKKAKRYKPGYCDRLNGPIQAGGADMLYRAMEYLIRDQENSTRTDADIIINTHDEIVLEAPNETAQDALVWLKGAMIKAARDFMRPELAGEDCVEGDVVPSWGGK